MILVHLVVMTATAGICSFAVFAADGLAMMTVTIAILWKYKE